ncbi:geranylgeranyl pyrophosphate synthase, chloroplastic-like [Hordeum vulgare subsp. vulgare]|uniref:Uncharacterized protein n=1 Tax=Hordeum vulgare subsp. vulgare TaxID=112509 RepID=A0A8I6YMW7_HORVV|nr:geranylgeranyl pyrophosphate synthase, chloroplastic-like [Hordeum vulgare subsp. vulgare]
MDKVACCCLQNGGPPPPSLLVPPCRRSISFTRRIPERGNTKLRAGFSSLDLEQYMSANVKVVQEALERALPVGQPERLRESMRYSVLACGCGKRVRPVLAIAACELVGGSRAVATPVACAVEMVHAWSLIRCDMTCMSDAAAFRRDRPANHVAFGEYTALYSGGTLLALAFEHLVRCADLGAVPAERALWAVAELGNAAGAGGVAAGMLADKASEGAPVSLAMLEYIHLHKTARLFEAAAVCGAIVGGGTEGEIESVRRYARSVGVLFQVANDVSGSGKAADKATYQTLLGVDQAQAYAAELVVKAQRELERFNANRAVPLHHLASFIAYRQK